MLTPYSVDRFTLRSKALAQLACLAVEATTEDGNKTNGSNTAHESNRFSFKTTNSFSLLAKAKDNIHGDLAIIFGALESPTDVSSTMVCYTEWKSETTKALT